jgi:hypothetical protein
MAHVILQPRRDGPREHASPADAGAADHDHGGFVSRRENGQLLGRIARAFHVFHLELPPGGGYGLLGEASSGFVEPPARCSARRPGGLHVRDHEQ